MPAGSRHGIVSPLYWLVPHPGIHLEKNWKKFLESSTKQNLNLQCTDNYLHSIYIVLGIIGNLEMILSIWEDVHRLYANTTPLPMRLEHRQILVSAGVLEPIPHGCQGMTILVLQRNRQSTMYALTPGRLSQSFFSVFRDQGLFAEYGGVTTGAKESSRKHCKTRTPVNGFTPSNFWGRELPLTISFAKDSTTLN